MKVKDSQTNTFKEEIPESSLIKDKPLAGGHITISNAKKYKMRRRIEEVSELLAKGYTPYQIMKKLTPRGKSLGYIYRLIDRINRKITRKTELNIEMYVARKEQQYAQVLREMWEAYELSKKDHQGQPRQPNVLYIDRILATLEAERKLHGLDRLKEAMDEKMKERPVDWDSLTAGRQLSSVTVNINGNPPAQSNNSDTTKAPVPTSSVAVPNAADLLRDEIDARIAELERRAEAKRAIVEDDETPTPRVNDGTGNNGTSRDNPAGSGSGNQSSNGNSNTTVKRIVVKATARSESEG